MTFRGWRRLAATLIFSGGILVACGPKRADIERIIGAGSVELHPLPAVGKVGAVAFADAPGKIVAAWVEYAEGRATGGIRFSTFDGTAWATPVTIAAGIDVADAVSRGPAISVVGESTIQVLWFGSREGRGCSPQLESSSDGGRSWGHLATLGPTLAAGPGAVTLLGAENALPMVAYVELWHSALQPLTDTALIAHPRLHVDGFEETFLETHVAKNSGISAVRFAGHGVVATRTFRSIESKTDGETEIAVYDVDPTGLAQGTAFDHDGWDMPFTAERVGPVLVTNGRRIAYAYYSAKRKGFPAIIVFFGAVTDAPRSHAQRIAFPDGIALPVIGDTRDISLHYSGDWIVVSAIEDGRLVEHYVGFKNFYSFQIAPEVLPASVRLEWTGSIGDRNYVAWNDGSQVTFGRAMHGPAIEAGKTMTVASGPGAIRYLGTPTPTPEIAPPAPDLP